MRIKRTKTGQGGPDSLPPSVAVHWAARVDSRGLVVAWTPREEEAGDFGAEAIARARRHYAGRANVGALEWIGPEPPSEPTSRSSEDGLREQIVQQAAQIEALRRDLEAATAPALAEDVSTPLVMADLPEPLTLTNPDEPPAAVPVPAPPPPPPVLPKPEQRPGRRGGRPKNEEH